VGRCEEDALVVGQQRLLCEQVLHPRTKDRPRGARSPSASRSARRSGRSQTNSLSFTSHWRLPRETRSLVAGSARARRRTSSQPATRPAYDAALRASVARNRIRRVASSGTASRARRTWLDVCALTQTPRTTQRRGRRRRSIGDHSLCAESRSPFLMADGPVRRDDHPTQLGLRQIARPVSPAWSTCSRCCSCRATAAAGSACSSPSSAWLRWTFAGMLQLGRAATHGTSCRHGTAVSRGRASPLAASVPQGSGHARGADTPRLGCRTRRASVLQPRRQSRRP
jgi:hypothetical protein